jgi:hypothetical protein
MIPRLPDLHDWVALDANTVRTQYLHAKAARLVLDHEVELLTDWVRGGTTLANAVSYPLAVRGDTDPDRPYLVWVQPHSRPRRATCSKGGVHDFTPDGDACSHMLAAAVWLVLRIPGLDPELEEEEAGHDS